ncbi:hypothetical protein JZ751_017233 [Albula glossodonta]|uniref:Ribosome biogenesis protein NOP53 n=1 Tax=Albula glossodonta TaxID=121402 RepID=A0A8T2MUH6_9TELE|nr:hypothetical protein JZ751_017233 [Albula glossodonta]
MLLKKFPILSDGKLFDEKFAFVNYCVRIRTLKQRNSLIRRFGPVFGGKAATDSSMAAARRNKRVAASQPGFLNLNPNVDQRDSTLRRRKRINKNKKKNWNKHSDIQDVEEFLDDVRLQERATGGLVSEKSDDSLFFVDTGEPSKNSQKGKTQKKGRGSRPLRIDLILQHDSLVPPPKDILSYQQPNAKKLRRISQKAEELAAKGVLPRKQRLLLRRKAVAGSKAAEHTSANKHPERPFYDLWSEPGKVAADPWYLEQTKKKLVKRPAKLNEKPSALPAVEVIAPGGSYNPEFFSHQALLLQAHEVEVKKQKEEQKVERQLAVSQEDTATEETVFQEQVEGLLEEEEGEEGPVQEDLEFTPDTSATPSTTQEKKTERQRKREKAEKEKPEGSILKDRFKSLQKRNLIEPRERAKFKRKHKLKYVEKRAFKAIT